MATRFQEFQPLNRKAWAINRDTHWFVKLKSHILMNSVEDIEALFKQILGRRRITTVSQQNQPSIETDQTFV